MLRPHTDVGDRDIHLTLLSLATETCHLTLLYLATETHHAQAAQVALAAQPPRRAAQAPTRMQTTHADRAALGHPDQHTRELQPSPARLQVGRAGDSKTRHVQLISSCHSDSECLACRGELPERRCSRRMSHVDAVRRSRLPGPAQLERASRSDCAGRRTLGGSLSGQEPVPRSEQTGEWRPARTPRPLTDRIQQIRGVLIFAFSARQPRSSTLNTNTGYS